MGVKNYKPTSAGRRQMSVSDFAELTRGNEPERSLLDGRKSQSGGRNVNGHVTSWHRGGGHKRRYRVIDFRRDKTDIPARVASIEYDPNRSANIALLNYRDGEKRYIIAPAGLKVGDELMSGENAEIRSRLVYRHPPRYIHEHIVAGEIETRTLLEHREQERKPLLIQTAGRATSVSVRARADERLDLDQNRARSLDGTQNRRPWCIHRTFRQKHLRRIGNGQQSR